MSTGASMASPPHGWPRGLGPLSNPALLPDAPSPAAASAFAPAHENYNGGEHEMTVCSDDLADDEDSWSQDELDEEEDNGDDDYGYDDCDEDAEDEESMHYVEHYSCPIHHHHSFSHQAPPHGDLHGYPQDDLEMSDDAGAPSANYVVSVANLLIDGGDMDGPAVPVSGVEVFSTAFLGAGSLDVAEPAMQAMYAEPPTSMGMLEDAVSGFLGQLDPEAAWSVHPLSVSNPNPTTIGPSNYGLTDFLHHWARQSRILQGLARGRCPWPARVHSLESSEVASIEYDDLEGDQCDLQGVDWEDIGVTRADARERRLLMYSNYVNIAGSDRWTPNLPDIALPPSESFFRFRRMDIRRNVHLSHFQLRNVFASTSRARVFYPTIGAVQQFNPMAGHSRAVMKLGDALASQISTLAAGYGVLVAGGFGGEYMLRHVDSGEPENTSCHEGVITSSISGITNHVAIHQARTSSAPLAAFASNDDQFRVLDITTETWLSQEALDFAPNCAALSPDGRLRVMVGDCLDVVITAAESSLPGGQPEVLKKLSGHRDYGFACDWADDGWTIATAFQDKTVKIWDARRFTDSSGNATSVCTIRSEMAGVRSLRFSPIGSGKRVLVAAEEADFVNIIDAQTFRSKQTIDIFGELGGISFASGGQDLMVLCCDRTRGGILQLERCGQGGEFMRSSDEEGYLHPDYYHRRGLTYDWPRSTFTEQRRAKESSSRRRRKAASQVELEPF